MQCQKGFRVAVFFKRQCYSYFARPGPENSDSGLMRFRIHEIDKFYLFHHSITRPTWKWIARHISFVTNVSRVNMPVRASVKLRRTKMIRVLLVGDLDFCRRSPYHLITPRRRGQIRHSRPNKPKNSVHFGRCCGKHSRQVEGHAFIQMACLHSGHLQRRKRFLVDIPFGN